MPAMPPLTAWSYSPPGDPMFADIDVVRLYLEDTDANVRLMSDAELQWLIDEWMPRYDSLIYVAAVAAEMVSAKFAGVVSVSADGVSVNVADLSARYAELAKRLRTLHKSAQIGELDITNLLWGAQHDHSIDPLEFGVSMHDNPAAGRQDYGSHRGYSYPFPEDTVRPGG